MGTMEKSDASLAGRHIGITGARKGREQAELFRRRDADVVHGPSTMITVDLSAEEPLRWATAAVVARPPDYVVVTTGMRLTPPRTPTMLASPTPKRETN